MSKTNFRKVKEFHKTFELDINNKPINNIFDINPKLVKLRMSLITEEVSELRKAMNNKNINDTLDALTDILYVVYGTGLSFGLDLDKAFDLVHKSNMSKSCITENEAKETIKWYQDRYKKNKSPYDTPAYKKSKGGNYWIIYNKSTGKILKSINYKPVDFTQMIKK